jgi:hypothetical protein
VPAVGPDQGVDVQGRAGEAGWAEPPGVGVQGGQHPAEVGDQPAGRALFAMAALDPGEGDAAPTGGQVRGGYVGAEAAGRDTQVGVTGKGVQPGQLAVEFGVAAAVGQAHPHHQPLAGGGVDQEQVVAVLAQPAQPTDQHAVLVQGGTGQPPQLVDGWLHPGLGLARPQVTHPHHATQRRSHWRANRCQGLVKAQVECGSWTTSRGLSLPEFRHPERASPYPIALQESQGLVANAVRAPLPDSTSLYQAEQ